MVTGAGPAGATAALQLARTGLRVTLIDREAFPRDKICGDLVGTLAIASLRELSIHLDAVDATEPLRGAYVYAPNDRRIGASVDERTAGRLGARVIPRVIFDAALVAAAQNAGATLLHARVTDVLRENNSAICGVRLADGTTLRAPLTIGADGWSSVIARAMGRAARAPRDTGVAVRAYVQDVRASGAMQFYIGAPGDGYGWIFPLADGRANVGLGFIRNEPGAGKLHAAFARFLERPELRNAYRLGPQRAWPIPLGWRAGPVSAQGALLAGDAASLASPLSGSGIYTAIASGALAAEVAAEAVSRGDVSAAMLKVYERRLQPIANRLRLERWLHGVAGTPAGSARAIRAAQAVPGAGRLAVGWLLSLG